MNISLIIRLILSVCIFSAVMINLNRLFELTIIPILSNGATGGLVLLYNSSVIPNTYIIDDRADSCSGVWSCSKLICDLYSLNNSKIKYVAISPNVPPWSNTSCGYFNSTDGYKSLIAMMIFSIITKIISLVFIIYISRYTNTEEQMLLNDVKNHSSVWWKLIILAFKIPTLATIVVIHIIISKKQYDDPPSNINKLENMESWVLAFIYIFDSLLLIYETS